MYDNGVLHSDPTGINAQFARYYEHLYTSRADFTLDSLYNFLDQIEFPQLSDEARRTLDAPITVKELQAAVAALQLAKTPGPDGFPAEFYKTNSKLLVPKFHGLLLTMLEEGFLPPPMLEAVIVVIPKPNKDTVENIYK